jgi:hypothetical protein
VSLSSCTPLLPVHASEEEVGGHTPFRWVNTMDSIIMHETICLLLCQYNVLFIATACFKWTDMGAERQTGQIHPAQYGCGAADRSNPCSAIQRMVCLETQLFRYIAIPGLNRPVPKAHNLTVTSPSHAVQANTRKLHRIHFNITFRPKPRFPKRLSVLKFWD